MGNMTRIENAINGIPQRIETTRGQLENYHNQVKAAEEELQRPFAHADELKEKMERLAKVNYSAYRGWSFLIHRGLRYNLKG